MTSVSAVFTLITKGIEKEFVAECAEDDLVELFLDKFMAVHLVDLAFAFADGALTSETTCIKRPLPDVFLDFIMRKA